MYLSKKHSNQCIHRGSRSVCPCCKNIREDYAHLAKTWGSLEYVPLYKKEQGLPGGFCPTLVQIIKGQMQLTICWLQLGRTFFILIYSYFMPVCIIVQTFTPRCRGRPDTLLHEAEGQVQLCLRSSTVPRGNSLDYTTNRHEITVL